MKVVIDAQVATAGAAGGIEQFLLGLLYGLAQTSEDHLDYVVIHERGAGWIEPYATRGMTLVPAPRPRSIFPDWSKKLVGPLRKPLARLIRDFVSGLSPPPRHLVPESDGFYESFGADCVHFPHQGYVRCRIPVIYNPHDLLHRHFPEFLPEAEIERRERVYRSACNEASLIVTESQWVKGDVIDAFRIDPEKVVVIRRGAPTELFREPTFEEISRVRAKYNLPQEFCLYPAQTWPHKNHLRLIEALARLRKGRSVAISLVCTGAKNEFWPTIRKYLRRHRLGTQVRFLGFVPPTELRALYRLAKFLVFPSLFEGGGFPILEAFSEGLPVTCSRAAAIPEYAGDAALFFDALSVDEIASALEKMASNDSLRESLREQGGKRARLFSWTETGRKYVTAYARVAASH